MYFQLSKSDIPSLSLLQLTTCDVPSEFVCGVQDADLLDDRENHQTRGLSPGRPGLWLHCFVVTQDLSETGLDWTGLDWTSPLLTDDVTCRSLRSGQRWSQSQLYLQTV